MRKAIVISFLSGVFFGVTFLIALEARGLSVEFFPRRPVLYNVGGMTEPLSVSEVSSRNSEAEEKGFPYFVAPTKYGYQVLILANEGDSSVEAILSHLHSMDVDFASKAGP